MSYILSNALISVLLSKNMRLTAKEIKRNIKAKIATYAFKQKIIKK